MDYHYSPETREQQLELFGEQLEEQFGIMMEPDDIVDLNSFDKGKEMLAAKYGVEFSA